VFDPEHPELGGNTPEEMRTQFARQLRYTAGLATKYPPNMITGEPTHQDLATGFEIGTRFHSAPVVRVADAKRMELGHTHLADGRWRLYAFGDPSGDGLLDLMRWLDAPADVDVHGVFQGDHHDVPDVTTLPAILLPRTGSLGLQDWEKVWASGPAPDIFERRGISRDGAIVIVRPDQYVAHVLPLAARDELTEFFAGTRASALR
jgi:phenol 2-monooxygenase